MSCEAFLDGIFTSISDACADDKPIFSEIVFVFENVLSSQSLKQEPLLLMIHKENEISTYNTPKNFNMSSSMHHKNNDNRLPSQSILNMTMSTTSESINMSFEERTPIDSVVYNVIPFI
uniref:Uncharacterized protein n=1 Tax=Strongyloides venezuelensis TaxID=75913 RepID=A0A0K0FET5_STRVS